MEKYITLVNEPLSQLAMSHTGMILVAHKNK